MLNRLQEEAAARLESEKQEQLRHVKTIQAIRENSEELKMLEKKLMEAYMNKERKQQIQEKMLNLKMSQVLN